MGSKSSKSAKADKAIKEAIKFSVNFVYFKEDILFSDYFSTTPFFNLKGKKPIRKHHQSNPIETISLEARPISPDSTARLDKAFDGSDLRRRVHRTQDWPSSAHGLVSVKFKGVPFWGTGTLIASNIVLTAARNVYSLQHGAYADSIEFLPGVNGNTLPFGKVKVEEWFVTPEYIASGQDKDNYALLLLDTAIGDETGYFGISVMDHKEIMTKNITVTGYPSDKIQEMSCLFEMWEQQDKPASVTEDKINYMISTAPGNCGGGVWYEENGNYYVVGVHLQGNSETNEALLLTKSHYEQLHKWIKDAMQSRVQKSPQSYIKKLNIGSKKLKIKGAETLSSYSMKNLQDLNVGWTRIGDLGLEALVKNSDWVNLQVLVLRNNEIGPAGIEVLAKSSNWVHLEELDLSENPFGFAGAEALGKNTTWTSLKSLRLSTNNIGDLGFEALAKNTSWVELEKLWVTVNQVGHVGIAALIENIAWANMKELCLIGNDIKDDGAEVLARNRTWTKLEKLNLIISKIGEKGAKELAKNTSWVNLKNLDMEHNEIGDDGVEALLNNTAWINLEKIVISDRDRKISKERYENHSKITFRT